MFPLQPSHAGTSDKAAAGSTVGAWPSLRDAKEQKVNKKIAPPAQSSGGDKQVNAASSFIGLIITSGAILPLSRISVE